MLHNRLVRLWGNPSTKKFKQFYASFGLFNSGDDAQNLIKFGAYLITAGNKKVLDIQPFDRSLGLKYWINDIEGEIYFFVGVEYFLKGLFLYKGYAINKSKRGFRLIEPYLIKSNRGKLDAGETHTLEYFTKHIDKLVDFGDFDKSQTVKNKATVRGKGSGLLSHRFKRPDHRALLDYLRFSRNKYVHTQKRIPEFRGITDDLMEMLNYMALQICNKDLDALADLSVISI